MNREITFRTWDKQEKQMVYGIEETYDGLPYSELNEKVELDIYNHMSCFSSWLCGDFEIMQYIGLKDRYNVEIYEGDICKVTHSNDAYEYTETTTIYEVGYSRYAFRFLRNKRKHSLELSKAIRIEVIGNIFQDEDLLEEEE